MVSQITTHVNDAKDRLIEQYKGAERFEGLLEAFNLQIQDIEDVIFGLKADLAIETASGAQLDLIGTIVVQPRLGFSDEIYRRLLRAKIGENVSTATIEDIVNVTKLLVGAETVILQEWFPAGFGLWVDVDFDPSLINFFYQRIDRVDAAGVRLEALICYDPDEAFAFDGGIGVGFGFSTISAPLTGGVLADYHSPSLPAFSFLNKLGTPQGGDQGFGTIEDVLFGGIIV